MVEIYFNQELSDITFEIEALDEWKSIAAELGMEKQLLLTKGVQSPVHYPFMNEVMKRVYETLCPTVVPFKEYKMTTIPLEVMKQIAFSVKEGNFTNIQIWYDDKSPDPLVVGEMCVYHATFVNGAGKDEYIKNENSYVDFQNEAEAKSYCKENGLVFRSATKQSPTLYIIARWGDELKTFSELKKLAMERFMENEGGEIKRKLAEYQEKIKLLTENTVSYFNGNINKYNVTGGW